MTKTARPRDRDDDDEPAPTTRPRRWWTFDEVVEELRFPSRRAFYAYLRRHPIQIYQRAGSRRYFVRAEDVDRMMVPTVLTRTKTAPFVPVDPATLPNGKRPRGRPKGSKNRPLAK
jgi:hypothetical protein